MNALDEWIKAQSRSNKAPVGKAVKISQNDHQWLNFALRKAFFMTKNHSQCIDKV